MDTVRESVVVTDPNQPDNPIVYVNAGFERLTGYTSGEVVGRNCRFLQGSDRDQPVLEELRAALQAEREFRGVVRNYRKDGSFFLNDLSIYPLHDAEGRLVSFIGVQNDVTGWMETEEKLRRIGEELAAAFESITDAFFTLDREWRFTYLNPEAERILGRGREELLGKELWEEFPEAVDLGFYGEYRRAVENQETVEFEGYYPPLGKWFEATIYPSESGVSVYSRDVTDRRRTEMEWREAETRFRSAFENTDIGMALTSPDNGRYLEVNQACCDILGYSEEELLATTSVELTHPEDREATVAYARRALAGEVDNYQWEKRYIHAGGRVIWASTGVSIVRDVDGRPRYFVVQMQDITKRKVLEEALRKSEERFRTIFEQSAMGISIADLDRRLLETNPAYQKMTGYSGEELFGRPIAEVSHPEDVPVDAKYNEKLLSGELDRYQREKRYVRKDGEVIWVRPTVSIVRNDEGEPQFLVGMVEDITGRKKAEAALRESEQRFRQLFEQSVDALIVHDEKGRIVDCNSEACRALGYTREELLSLRVKDIATGLLSEEEKREKERAEGTLWQRAIRGEPDTFGIVHYGEHKRKDGTTFPVEVRVGGVNYGGRRMILASVRDITERKEAELRLEESRQRYKSLFEHNPDAVYSFDLEGNFLNANPVCARLSGYPVDELLQMSFMPLVVPEDRERTWQSFEEAAEGEPQNYEVAITRKDGRRVELNATKLPIIVGGEVVGVYGIAKDITGRKRAEAALRESEERYRSLVELSPDAIVVHSGGEIVYVNAAGVEMFGASTPDDLVGRKALDFVHPDYRELVEERNRRALEDGVPAPLVEEKYFRLDGSVIDVEVAGVAINYLGKPAVQVVVRDVTDRRRIQRELGDSERRYRSVLERTTDGIYIYDFDTKRILECNTALEELLGCTSEELVGTTIYDLIAHDRESIARNGRRILQERSVFIGERRYRRKDGALIDVETSAVLIPYGDNEAVCTIVRDVTRRKRTEAALRRQSAAMDTSIDGIAILDRYEKHVYVNSAYADMYGYRPDELIGESWRVLYDERERKRFDRHVIPALRRKGRWRGEGMGRRRDGSAFPQDASFTLLEDGEAVCVVRDITERAELEKQLAYQALHDSLTGLPNRSLFMEHVERALARQGRREDSTVAVLFLDLDGFKRVNDTLGHSAGDQLLVTVAERLRDAARAEDTIARLGGDEFTVLLEVGDVGEAERVARRIIAKLREPFFLEEHEVRTTTSVGIALGGPGDEPESLLRDADLAMYEAKQSGRGGYEVFDVPVRADAVERFRLKTDINKAVERDELRVQYQPKVEIATGRVIGFEALVRWEHPELGLVSPVEFIPEVEDTGLISSIGRWVFREACYQAAEWQELYPEDPPLLVCVNLSPVQLRNPNLADEVSSMLRESGVDPAGVCLEVTERTSIRRGEQMENRLRELKGLGLQLGLDDFGSGYSSLSYLRRLPADMLKIDQSFTEELPESSEARSIVSALIRLARDLDMRVIAEGVENAGQLQCLKDLGCHMAQGHYLGEPLDAREASDLLRASRRR